jgi:hypothetical protein
LYTVKMKIIVSYRIFLTVYSTWKKLKTIVLSFCLGQMLAVLKFVLSISIFKLFSLINVSLKLFFWILRGKIMIFFFKYPDGTDFLVGLQCFKSKTIKVKQVQGMHRHLLCLQNTSEKKSPWCLDLSFS